MVHEVLMAFGTGRQGPEQRRGPGRSLLGLDQTGAQRPDPAPRRNPMPRMAVGSRPFKKSIGG